MKHINHYVDEEEDAEVPADAQGAPAAHPVGAFLEALEFDADELGDLVVDARAELYVDGDAQPKSVPQHIHYSLRGPGLALLSLHDYCRLVVVKPLTALQQQQQQQQQQQPIRAGRRMNARFQFDPEHPLHASHVQCLRSKHCTVQTQPRPPRMPELPSAITGSKAAAYYLTLFKPWSAHDMPDLSYATWKQWCRDLSEDPTCINRYRLAVMTRMSQGMASSTKNVDAARAYRCVG